MRARSIGSNAGRAQHLSQKRFVLVGTYGQHRSVTLYFLASFSLGYLENFRDK